MDGLLSPSQGFYDGNVSFHLMQYQRLRDMDLDLLVVGLRGQLGDPILVRAGRRMTPAGGLDLARLERLFRIHATDHVLSVIGAGRPP